MKKYANTNTFLVLMAGVLLCSCSAKNLLTLSVTEPAPVHVSSAIKKVGIIDRSLPSDKTAKIDKLDKILSAEGKNLDKDGAKESVTGLSDELIGMGRFDEVKIINDRRIRSQGVGVLPAALSWNEIDRICKANKVDAIFSLSLYDTDSKIDYKTAPVEIVGPLGVKVQALEHHATIATLIKTGWRIYDPGIKNILDEYLINDEVVLTGKGINPVKAAEAIMGRREAVLQMSNSIGRNYAKRILTYRTRVSRYYYVRGTDNFKIAKRRAQTGNWDGAAELWDKEVSNPKPKVAGRACYNMAIINEINGDLDAAVEWASKSYTDYKDKLALRYIKILNNRINRNRQLQNQLND